VTGFVFFSCELQWKWRSQTLTDAICGIIIKFLLLTVAALSEPQNVFSGSNTGVVVRNPLEVQMFVFTIYSVFVVLYVGRGLATG
jgi:hypothetical protein